MKRLDSSTLSDLPSSVRTPAYDRDRLGIGMAHLGVGAFHRCHQAEYTDDALEHAFGDWGVVGINLRGPPIAPALKPQSGLYVRGLTGEDGAAEYRAIGCLRAVVDVGGDPGPALGVVADPRVAVVTITVTEKGYCHVPASGALDETHPDILHDLAHPATPRSLPGFLVAALERRRAASPASPITLMSCDNIPANGAVLHRVVRSLAEQGSPGLLRWIDDRVRFPSSMVDRIVPAMTEADRARVGQAIGLDDQGCVMGEPFRQWVIEDAFAGAAPRWDLAGAQFVPDVVGHELVKMRVLNGAQSAFCTLGALLGLRYTSEDACHPLLGTFVGRMLEEETATTLPAVSGMAAGPYIATAMSRLRNPAIRHTNHQIATDGSQKIVQRLLNPMRDQIAAGRPFDRLACAVAGFIAYLASASPVWGARWIPSDPYADLVRRIADETGRSPERLAAAVLGIQAIFGTDLAAMPKVVATIASHVAGLLSGPEAHLERF